MPKVEFLFLDRAQVESLVPPMAEVVEIVEAGLKAHGRGDVVLPPKAHIHLDDRYNGHFNVLPGYAGPIDTAGVKVVGDYVDNWKHGLPSEVGMLTLYEPRVGAPRCLMDATVLGHIGARGSAFSNIAAVAANFALTEVRIAAPGPRPGPPWRRGSRPNWASLPARSRTRPPPPGAPTSWSRRAGSRPPRCWCPPRP